MSQPYKSGRQQNLNLGITSVTENRTVLQTIGKVGIGTTNAQNHSLFVVGTTNITGDINVGGASTFVGVGTFGDDLYVANQLYVGGVSITGGATIGEDVVTRNILASGISTFNGNVDANGDLDVDGQTELDNLNVSGIATIQNLDVQGNFDVYDTQAVFHNNLYITGNLSIGGTTTVISAQDLRIFDKEITLGITTGAFGNDVSSDITANHGGIAIASTEGSPLVDLTLAGFSSLPPTYKQLMWVAANSYGFGTTDAWMFNYAVGIGSTLIPNGVRFAVKDIQFTDDTINTPNINVSQNLNVTGLSTFVGIVTTSGDLFVGGDLYVKDDIFFDEVNARNAVLTGDLSVAGVSTFAGVIDADGGAIISNQVTLNNTLSVTGVSTFSDNIDANGDLDVDGRTELDTTNISETLNVVGIVTLASAGGITTTGGDLFVGGDLYISDDLVLDELTARNINITGITTVGVVNALSVNATGIITASSFRPTSGYYQSANGTNSFYVYDGTGNVAFQGTIGVGQINSGQGYQAITLSSDTIPTVTFVDNGIFGGVVTARQFVGDITAGVATITNANITNLSGTNLNYTGIGTIDGVTISSGIITSSQPGVTTVKYYGDGSNLIGVNAFNVVNQVLSASPVYPTFANNIGVTSIGIADTEMGFIPTSGNLGIGSTNPIAKLNVVGDAIFTGIVTAQKFVGDIEATGPASIINATNLYVSGIGTIDGVTIASGIVTSSQPGVTTVKYYGDGSNLIGVNAFNVIQQDITSSPVFPTFANSTGVTSIGIAPTQIGYVPTSGNLGIGSTNPTAKLQVVGDVLISGVTTASQFVGDVNAGIATINKLDVNQISPDGVDFGGAQYVLRATGSGTWEWAEIPGIFSVNNILNGFNVYDEGVVVGTAGSITTLDFRGNNIIASADPQPNGIATVRVSDTPTFLNLTVTPGISTLGHINATSASFTGNVSIAGTLTYEDVTNIDSIGIITARSDVIVGGGLSVTGVSTFNNTVINGTISTGSTTGVSGQYLQSTGVGVTWATFPTLRTTGINTATAGQSSFSFSYNVNFLDVFVNGVKLTASEYVASNGTSVTLNSPAFANDIVEFVSYNTTSTGGGGGGGGGGGATLLDDLTDVNLSLPPAAGENLTYDGSYWVNDYTVTATTSTISQTAIHSLSASSYRSVEYMIQATQGSNYHVTKVLAIHNGTLAYPTEYGTIYTNGSLGAFDVDISGGNMRLLVTPASSSSTTYKIKFTAIKV